MSELFRNKISDERIIQTEEVFRTLLEKSLSTFLQKEIQVAGSGPHAFEFKETKAVFPGEVVVCTLTCTDGAQGKFRFVISKETAARVADLLLMGDGTAEFAVDQHLEPLRDLFAEILISYSSKLKQQIGQNPSFDDVKIVVIDLAPNDFGGESWIASSYEFELGGELRIICAVSSEFYDYIFPREGVQQPEPEQQQQEAPRATSVNEEVQNEIGLVMDIELPISIELGRTNMLIRDIVNLAPGSVVELNKLSGEPVDIYVNRKRFARGEVVVVDENFAVRLTELENPEDRLAASRN